MDFLDQLNACMDKNDSLACVGLDCDTARLPQHLTGTDAVFTFAKEIIDATADLVCAYKPNSAFYEAHGAAGIEQLKKICDYINTTYPHIPIILDAKRGDIGNTNTGYTTFAFDYLSVQAITVQPYMGSEALQPFLDRKERGIIVLCRTSNPGGGEFQDLTLNGKKLYQIVAEQVQKEWNVNGNCLLVVGAQHINEMTELRKSLGDNMTFLVPGVGAQGADATSIVQAGTNQEGTGLIISSTRDILFASSGEDFADAARQKTLQLRDEINSARTDVT